MPLQDGWGSPTRVLEHAHRCAGNAINCGLRDSGQASAVYLRAPRVLAARPLPWGILLALVPSASLDPA